MAKKKEVEKDREVEFALDVEEQAEAAPVKEQPAETPSEKTVCKPVGQGGPVPIVAPKHNTVQLQPIVVPLAVVPYMSQDSSVLRTDGKPHAREEAEQDGEAAEFEAVGKKKRRSSGKGLARVFSLVGLLLFLVLLVPFILSDLKGTLGSVILEEFNLIGAVKGWAESGFSASPYTNLVYLGVAFFAALGAIATFISLIAGRYPRAFSGITAFIILGGMAGVLIADCVRHTFVVAERTAFIVLLSVAALNFILAIVFSQILNRREDRLDEMRYSSEI